MSLVIGRIKGRVKSVLLVIHNEWDFKSQKGLLDTLGRDVYLAVWCCGESLFGIVNINDGLGQQVKQSTWWNEDWDGNVIIAGSLQNNQLVISPSAGVRYRFADGLRGQETKQLANPNRQLVDAFLGFTGDGLLQTTTLTPLSLSIGPIMRR